MSHTKANKDQLLARARRIAGQVAGVRGSVLGLMDELIEGHVREHVSHPALSPDGRAQGAEEPIEVIRRYAK